MPYTPIGWASTVAIMLFLGGTQLLMLGIFGEYLASVHDEVRHRPMFIVRRRVGLGPAAERADQTTAAEALVGPPR